MRKAVTTSTLLGLVATGLMTGCPDRTISEVNPEQGRVESKSFPIDLNRDVDILFVIDDSGSMRDKQANLRANFPNFINVLQSIQGGLPNVHLGVVTSDMGGKAEEDAQPGSAPGCSGSGKDGVLQSISAVNGAFISDIKNPDGSRSTNYTGDLASVFGQMAEVGDTGCGFEQHLAAMKRALSNPANSGFIRENAFLAVIFLADEDDCSMSHATLLGADGGPLGTRQSFRCTRFGVLCDVGGATDTEMNQVGVKDQCHPNEASAHVEKVATYANFLKSLKADQSKIVVAGVFGNLDPFAVEMRDPGDGVIQPTLAHSCSYVGPDGETEFGDPPVRLQFFLDQFPNRSTSTTICQEDLSGGLQLIGELLKEAIGNPCITGKLQDKDPGTGGIQPDCTVSSVINFGTPTAQETPLPECTGSNEPCWEIRKDVAACPCNNQIDPTCDVNNEFDNLLLDIKGTLDGSAQIVANCVTDA